MTSVLPTNPNVEWLRSLVSLPPFMTWEARVALLREIHREESR